MSEVKRVLEGPFQRRAYRVTAGLVGRIVRWPSEARITQSLSFSVAATEILTQSESLVMRRWLSGSTGSRSAPREVQHQADLDFHLL